MMMRTRRRKRISRSLCDMKGLKVLRILYHYTPIEKFWKEEDFEWTLRHPTQAHRLPRNDEDRNSLDGGTNQCRAAANYSERDIVFHANDEKHHHNWYCEVVCRYSSHTLSQPRVGCSTFRQLETRDKGILSSTVYNSIQFDELNSYHF